MLCAKLPFRGADSWGSGAYKAPRGDKLHRGVDYTVTPGTYILSPCVGRVTKLGYPYGWVENATNYRYVEITDLIGNRHRVFYIEPLVYKGEAVTVLTPIGIAQDISQKYQDKNLSPMTPHLHLEVITPDGTYINPEETGHDHPERS